MTAAIAASGDAASTPVPAGAHVIDLTGKTLIPGLVMLHEHMFYPAGGGGAYNDLIYSFPRLYLAGGVTTMRTAGNMAGYTDFNVKRMIDAGEMPGPKMDATGPYLEGPGLPIPSVKALKDAADARRMVNYWADEGATSFKAYMHITRAELGAAVEEAHKRGLKITGHLCSVTFSEAADLGIDDLEHGLIVSTDFVADKKPDECPPGAAAQASIIGADLNGPAMQALIRKLVDKHVAVTSTLTVFETSVPGRLPASDAALDAMEPEVRDSYLRRRAAIAVSEKSPMRQLFPKEMAFEHAFAKAGGLLVAGTDPTGYGGVVAGFSDQREIELLVEAGFTPVEAIGIGTMNGAKYLGREASDWIDCGGQGGRSRRRRRRPGRADLRHHEGRDRLQGRRRLRLGEADCRDEGARRTPVSAASRASIRWRDVVRDVAIVWLLTFTGGVVAARVGTGPKAPVLVASNLITGVIAFTFIGYLTPVRRFRHLLVVAFAAWLSGLLNVLFFGNPVSSWIVSLVYLTIVMMAGGLLSYLFKRPAREP